MSLCIILHLPSSTPPYPHRPYSTTWRMWWILRPESSSTGTWRERGRMKGGEGQGVKERERNRKRGRELVCDRICELWSEFFTGLNSQKACDWPGKAELSEWNCLANIPDEKYWPTKWSKVRAKLSGKHSLGFFYWWFRVMPIKLLSDWLSGIIKTQQEHNCDDTPVLIKALLLL